MLYQYPIIRSLGVLNQPPSLKKKPCRATALSLPDNYAEIVGRKETRPTYAADRSKTPLLSRRYLKTGLGTSSILYTRFSSNNEALLHLDTIHYELFVISLFTINQHLQHGCRFHR